MFIALIIALSVISYVCTGAFIGAKHHMITARHCKHYPDNCLKSYWDGHVYTSLWTGVLWPVAVPALVAARAGMTTKESRAEKKRADELEQAKHDAEVAKYKRIEDEELTRQLEFQQQQRSLRA